MLMPLIVGAHGLLMSCGGMKLLWVACCCDATQLGLKLRLVGFVVGWNETELKLVA